MEKHMMKKEIRRRMKNLRTMLSESEKEEAALRVFQTLEKNAAFLMADRILMYHSLPDELTTHRFLQKWGAEKRFFLPRVNGVNLEILPYNPATLAVGAYDIEEPEGDTLVDPASIEVIIVPAVAYDRSGMRLGRGKGFYDRLLAETKATKIGIGYDFQLYDTLPAEPHDIPMDIVITESEVIVIDKR